MIWILVLLNTFMSVTALRGLWNLIERVDHGTSVLTAGQR